MKKIIHLFCAMALAGATGAGFVACDDPPEPAPEPENILVETDFVIENGLEYPSDIVVELKDGRTLTVRPGEKQVIHSYGEIVHEYAADGTPATQIPYKDVIPNFGVKAYGAAVLGNIHAPEHWTASGKKEPAAGSGADYRYTVTLTVTNELLKALNGPEPDRHFVHHYRITNCLTSDITIALHDGWYTTIKPGEEKKIGTDKYTEPWGMVVDIVSVVSEAQMTVRGEVVHESIWWLDPLYWQITCEVGEDEYHTTTTYSLNVTEELLAKVRGGEK